VSQHCLEKQPLVLAELLRLMIGGGQPQVCWKLGEEKTLPNIAPLNRQGKVGLTVIELWEIGEDNMLMSQKHL
jgi:hypothetical protein